MVSFVLIVAFERRFTREQFKTKHAKAPNINRVIVAVAQHHFRRQVVERSACRLAFVRAGMNAPAKISNFQFAPETDEKIFGFQITSQQKTVFAYEKRKKCENAWENSEKNSYRWIIPRS